MLQRGRVQLTDLGLFVAEGDNYIPIGFNPWPETSTKMAIGKLAEMNGALVDEEIGLIAKTNLPPGFLDPNITPAEKKQRIVSNMRALLLFLGAKVIIYPDRKEIRGAIHPQIIKNTTMDSSAGVPITSSAKGD
jgi:hypothetical protein